MDFFFQAEDGIRDAQESRGLGDVYKRQVHRQGGDGRQNCDEPLMTDILMPALSPTMEEGTPVSYTHLTLPTIYSV